MSTPGSAYTVETSRVRAHLQKILQSDGFSRAPRMARFLTFVVEAVLAGKAADLKETVIGAAVFDRTPDYDPKSDPVVRVEARRLRSKLEGFYEDAGRNEPIRIELPKGSYVPVWRLEPVASAEQPQPAPVKPVRWIVPAALSLVLVVLAVLLSRYAWRREVRPTAPITSLVVLPFENLATDSSQDYLIDGFTDEITTNLAKIPGLKVISRTSAQSYRASRKRLPEIARELNVDAVVEGTVLTSSNRVRVTAQLIRAATDTHLWADTYERDTDNLFALQAEIAEAIARQIGATLKPVSYKTEPAQAAHAAAFDDYLRGRYFWNKRTVDGLQKSISYFEKAIERDPQYAEAYAALGDSYKVFSIYGGMPPQQSMPRARAAAEKALQIDPTLAEAHTLLASIKDTYDRNWGGAEPEYRRAIELKPSYPTAHLWYARGLGARGFFPKAMEEVRRADDLDPLSLIITTDVGEMLYWARQPQAALNPLQRTLELDPAFAAAHMVLGKVFEEQHRFSEALQEFRSSYALSGNSPSQLALIAHAQALSGDRAAAREAAIKLEALRHEHYIEPTDIAMIYCALGETGEGAAWFDKALEEHEDELMRVRVEPLFDGCRSDASFQALLQRLAQ